MNDNIQSLIERLEDKNANSACESCDKLCEIAQSDSDVKKYLPLFFSMLKSKNSLVRSRAFHLISACAKWDSENFIDENFDEFLLHITDEKPIAARQCIKYATELLKYKPQLARAAVRRLETADVSCYADSMRPLIEKDIAAALTALKA